MGFRVRTPASEVLCKGEPRAVPCLPGLLLSALLAHPSPQKLSRPDSRLRWLDSALWSSCAGYPEVNCSKQALAQVCAVCSPFWRVNECYRDVLPTTDSHSREDRRVWQRHNFRSGRLCGVIPYPWPPVLGRVCRPPYAGVLKEETVFPECSRRIRAIRGTDRQSPL